MGSISGFCVFLAKAVRPKLQVRRNRERRLYSDAELILQSSFRHCSGIGLLPHWYGIGQNLKCGTRKSMHVGEPLGAAGLKRNSPLNDASDSETSVAGRIAVAVAGRSGRTGFTQAPGCGEA
jgi:hypothetical protein